MKWRLLPAAALLVAGAFLPMSPADTWTSGAEGDGPTGAPAAAGPDNLVDARRAAGEASSQAGFLTQGSAQLKDGAIQLDEGSQELIDGISAAHSGAQELSQGMVELQAGTGQLADGATRIADTVGGVVDQVVGFDAVRGQVVAGIDSALDTMRGSRDPDVARARDALRGLREQALVAELPPDIVAQLNELKDGSREVANQLAVPGYAYHDGVYSATNGAAALASGLTELNEGAGAADEGVGALRDGAEQLDQVAGLTADKITAVQRALPAAPPTAGAGEEAPASALAPLAAMLISALLLVGGAAIAAVALALPRLRWWVLGAGGVFVALLGFLLVFLLGVGLGPAALAASLLACAVATFASAGLTTLLIRALGARAGGAAAAAFVAAQIAVVGWVWKVAATGAVSAATAAVSAALPMHWSTAALSAAGNQGSAAVLWVGVGLSAAAALLGLVGVRRRGA
ncbi:hypothetical protein [Corynebacterium auris]|uniref:hypothetical protein n=1 Tax=Corynebacterium auris TaxID=44750 RepID=UPI0025B44EEC|nr:hypothetical protein [Corynebacterium auris]WJY67120.1 hypothetical protein CAURIS_00895 [Corynebacterium auris]